MLKKKIIIISVENGWAAYSFFLAAYTHFQNFASFF